MNQDELITLINKLETYSSANPEGYRMRVALLASLGYAYLAAIVIALLLLVYVVLFQIKFSGITLKLVWIPLVLVGLILRSLWITIPEPDGHPLEEADAPDLFQLIREVQQKLKGPPVHKVLLSDEFNAGIVQIPRFGMFGLLKNYMVVGLPLLTALRPAELRAVLAHEFGHLSGKHGRFSGWIYRVRQSWIQILTAVHHERHYASFLFEPFLNWYAPFFNAYSFVLARTQEYEADESAAKLSGQQTFARALVQLSLIDREMSEKFWPGFYRGAHDEPQPPKDPFAKLVRHVSENAKPKEAEKWFVQELRVKTGYDDTHPSLADRLARLGFDPVKRQETIEQLVVSDTSFGERAVDRYLNQVPEELIQKSNRLLRERIVPAWREIHGDIQQARRRLSELETQAQTRALSPDEQWERVTHVAQIDSPKAALDPLRELLAVVPTHAPANFAVGSILLEEGDDAGIGYLESTIQQDPSASGQAWEKIAIFHLEQGRHEEAEKYIRRAEEFNVAAQKAHEKSVTLSPDDRFEPHGLSEEQVRDLQSQMAKVRGLTRVYLARKVIPGQTDQLYVFGVIADYTWRDGVNDKHVDALLGDLVTDLSFDKPSVFVSLEGEYRYLLSQFNKVARATIFSLEGVVEAEIEMRH